LIQLAGDLNYQVVIRWSGSGGAYHFDAVFFREEILSGRTAPLALSPAWGEEVIAGADWNRYANDPLQTESSTALTAELRSHVKQKLPEYMTPSVFVIMDELPMTPNGKLDRYALPTPEEDDYLRRSYEPPAGETEVKLAMIWAELLNLERVGRHDNFFELGGHSLLTVKMIERMRRAGLPSDVRMLFTSPTLAELAAAIEDVEILL
jgi:hypothetical protein